MTREKELTRALDGLNADRRRLPMVRVEKDYRFTGPDGEVGLVDLFDGRGQLVLQHFMFDPSWDRGCGSCTAMADDLSDGARAHLAARDTAFAAVSRAPYPKLAAYRQERGWAFPWYSSYGSDFNYDFHVSLDPAVTPSSGRATSWPPQAGLADRPRRRAARRERLPARRRRGLPPTPSTAARSR